MKTREKKKKRKKETTSKEKQKKLVSNVRYYVGTWGEKSTPSLK